MPPAPSSAAVRALVGRSRIPVLTTVREVRAWRASARDRGLEVGFVPTMGSLHQGHLDLVSSSLARSPRTLLSIFVNPSQFAPTEDLATYPRNLASDLRLLEGLLPPVAASPPPEAAAAGALPANAPLVSPQVVAAQEVRPPPTPSTTTDADSDSPLAVFCPSVAEMYPNGITTDRAAQRGTFVEVKGFGDVLEGKTRPNFFRGVATVVTKLFNIVEPDVAHFGQKDIQQALLLRIMLRDLLVSRPAPGNLVIHPTTRAPAPSSLALSSRNAYLSPAGLAAAPALHRALSAARDLWASQGGATASELQAAALAVIRAEEERTGGLVAAEYVELFHPSSFAPPAPETRVCAADGGEGWVLAGAMRCDGVRLIDNLLLGVDVGGGAETAALKQNA